MSTTVWKSFLTGLLAQLQTLSFVFILQRKPNFFNVKCRLKVAPQELCLNITSLNWQTDKNQSSLLLLF